MQTCIERWQVDWTHLQHLGRQRYLFFERPQAMSGLSACSRNQCFCKETPAKASIILYMPST